MPKRSHELALKRLGRYLCTTMRKGLILNPSKEIYGIDAFSDAVFSGRYGHERSNDPTCVKSRSGYVIMFANCPLLWRSTLQIGTATSAV